MCHYFTFQQLANSEHSNIYFKIGSQHTSDFYIASKENSQKKSKALL